MYRSIICAALAILVIGALSHEALAANVNDFLVYNYTDSSNNVILPGRLFVPADYAANPNVPRPIILFLHGSGESGTNNTAQVNGNIDNLFAAAKARGAFLYAPQTNSGWDSPALLGDALSMIDRAITDRDVDPNRVYVTGLSMGGGGAWNFLNDFPDRVAATVPICASPPSYSAVFNFSSLLGEPIWAHHGRFDTNVPADVTRSMIDTFLGAAGIPAPTYPKLNSFGPDLTYDFPSINLRYSDYQGSHDIWPRVYARPDLYDWMFAQGAVPEPNTIALALVLLSLTGFVRRTRTSIPQHIANCPAIVACEVGEMSPLACAEVSDMYRLSLAWQRGAAHPQFDLCHDDERLLDRRLGVDLAYDSGEKEMSCERSIYLRALIWMKCFNLRSAARPNLAHAC